MWLVCVVIGLVVAVPVHEERGLVDEDSRDLLPEHTQSLDVATLLHKYAAELDGKIAISTLLQTEMNRVQGRSSGSQSLKRFNAPGGVVRGLSTQGTEFIDDGSMTLTRRTTAASSSAPSEQPANEPLPLLSNVSLEREVTPASVDTATKADPPALASGPPRYEFECRTSRSFAGTTFDAEEMAALQADVCRGESGRQWNGLVPEVEARRDLSFIVDAANFQTDFFKAAASLAVRSYVLQPFESCNRRVATCAMVNAMHNSHLTFKKGVGFWDLKAHIDRLEGDSTLGEWDHATHQVKLVSATAADEKIDELARWMRDHVAVQMA